MKTILVSGSSGQIGSQLMTALRSIYGKDHVIATDIKPDAHAPLTGRLR